MTINCSRCGFACDENVLFCPACSNPLATERKPPWELVAPVPQVSPPEIAASSTGIEFKANPRVVADKMCLRCGQRFTLAEEAIRCERCNGVYHKNCWNGPDQQGCANPGCRADHKQCPRCGKLILKTALKCRFCSTFFDESVRPNVDGPKTVAEGATISLVIGIIGIFLFGIILGWIAIANGNKALKIVKLYPERFTGKGLAIAGITLGVFDILGCIAVILLRFG